MPGSPFSFGVNHAPIDVRIYPAKVIQGNRFFFSGHLCWKERPDRPFAVIPCPTLKDCVAQIVTMLEGRGTKSWAITFKPFYKGTDEYYEYKSSELEALKRGLAEHHDTVVRRK